MAALFALPVSSADWSRLNPLIKIILVLEAKGGVQGNRAEQRMSREVTPRPKSSSRGMINLEEEREADSQN